MVEEARGLASRTRALGNSRTSPFYHHPTHHAEATGADIEEDAELGITPNRDRDAEDWGFSARDAAPGRLDAGVGWAWRSMGMADFSGSFSFAFLFFIIKYLD